MSPYTPQSQEWEMYKGAIVDLYQTKRMTMKKLIHAMKLYYGFDATRRQYIRHLHQWGIRKYSNQETKDLLCERILSDLLSGQLVSYISPGEARKLLRHCREKRSSTNKVLLDFLHLTSISSSTQNPDENYEEDLPAIFDWQNYELTADQILAEWSEGDDGRPAAEMGEMDAEDSESEDFDDLSLDIQQGFANDQPVYTSSESAILTPDPIADFPNDCQTSSISKNLPPSLINHFAKITDAQSDQPALSYQLVMRGSAFALEEMLHLTRTYYLARLGAPATFTNSDDASGTALINQQSKIFWSSVKTAIYFLKMQDPTQGYQILQEVGAQIPNLCQTQPLSLLRELLTTLSIANTKISPETRTIMLRMFAVSSRTPQNPNDMLSTICSRLQEDWACDEALMTVLCAITRTAEETLPPENNEILELQRARIQLLRRKKELATAEYIALDAQRGMECLYGKDDVKTRLIMSERIYILNEQHKSEDAVEIAKDVISRAQRDERLDFPSERSIYQMEDLAEVYERLNRLRDATLWLRRALKGALNVWTNRESTIHINDKLEKLRIKMEGVAIVDAIQA